MADDMLSLTALGVTCPIAIAPAMDGAMYENAAVKANLETLRRRGMHIIAPERGRFASGLTGQGRLPETADFDRACAAHSRPQGRIGGA